MGGEEGKGIRETGVGKGGIVLVLVLVLVLD
jgi:hypothetical protein